MEMMVVIAIIGIAVTMAAPSLNEQMRRQAISDDLQAVTNGLQQVRNYARTRIRCVEVVVTPQQIVATPHQSSTPGPLGSCADADVPIPEDVITVDVKHVTLGAFSANGLGGSLWFDQRASTLDGASYKGLYGPADLSITAPIGGPFRVRVFPATGAVRLLK